MHAFLTYERLTLGSTHETKIISAVWHSSSGYLRVFLLYILEKKRTACVYLV